MSAGRAFRRRVAARDGERIAVRCSGCSTGFAEVEVTAGEVMRSTARHDAGCIVLAGDPIARARFSQTLAATLGATGPVLVAVVE